jgi:hypothetical protein
MQALVGGGRAAKARPGDHPAQAADAAEPRNASRGSAASSATWPNAPRRRRFRHAISARRDAPAAAASQAQKRDQLRDAHYNPAGAANAVKQPRARHAAAAPRACAFNPLCDSRSCRASSATQAARSERSRATPHSDINFEAFASLLFFLPLRSCSDLLLVTLLIKLPFFLLVPFSLASPSTPISFCSARSSCSASDGIARRLIGRRRPAVARIRWRAAARGLVRPARRAATPPRTAEKRMSKCL